MKDVYKMLKQIQLDLAKVVKIAGMPRPSVRSDDGRTLRSRLTIAQRKKIKDLLAKGKKVKDLADKFGVTQSTIYGIRSLMQKDEHV